jgi:nucleotide-binding universal stress UspA family protein
MSSLVPSVDVGVKSVLFATDFSKARDKPLHHALAIARHYGAKFYLSYVVSSLGFSLAGADALELATDAALRDARNLEHHLMEMGALPGLQHQVVVRKGTVWEELEKVVKEERIDLMVVGTHGRRALGKLFLGSVAEQIFRRVSCPVLTVGPGSCQDAPIDNTKTLGPILFATDFGAASLEALPHAVSYANHFGARLLLLHVVSGIPNPERPYRATVADLMKMRENARVATLHRLKELARRVDLAVQPEYLVEFGMPGETILQAAGTHKAAVIIMGLNRSAHISTAAHVPWTIAHEVVGRAACPVLTVRS